MIRTKKKEMVKIILTINKASEKASFTNPHKTLMINVSAFQRLLQADFLR